MVRLSDDVQIVEATTTKDGRFVFADVRAGQYTLVASLQAPTVGVYVDEIALPYSILTRGAQLDLERVEILRGPQGTLFGLSTTGGAINYIARKPTRAFEASLNVEAGRFGRYSMDGFLSGPLSRTLSARIALSTHQGGAWQESATRADDLGRDNTTSLRGQVMWSPSPRVTARFGYSQWSDSGDPLAGQVLGVSVQNPSSPTRQTLLQTPVTATGATRADWPAGFVFGLDQRFRQGSASLHWRLGRGLDLTALSGAGHFSRDDMQPEGGGPVQNADLRATDRLDFVSQEVRVSRSGARLTWVTGAYGAWNRVRAHELTFVQTNSVAEYVTGIVDFDRYYNDGTQETRTGGGFGHADWSPTRAWTVTAGARYTNDHKTFVGCTGDPGDGAGLAAMMNITLRTTVFAPGQCVSVGPDRLPGPYRGSLSEIDLSGRLGLNWKPRAEWLVHGSVSRGFKPGSFPLVAANSHTQFEPVRGERVVSYEAGVKTDLHQGAAQVHGSIFHYDYTDKQIRGATVDPIFRVLARLVNIPRSRVTGGELALTVRPFDALSIGVAGAWLTTEVTSYYWVNAQRIGDYNVRWAGRPRTVGIALGYRWR